MRPSYPFRHDGLVASALATGLSGRRRGEISHVHRQGFQECGTGVYCDCVLNKNTRMFEKLTQYIDIWLILTLNVELTTKMLIRKLRVIRSRVKSASFNGVEF